MIKNLIDFFENASIEEVTSKLKSYNVEFVTDEVNKYENILESKKISISKIKYNAEINSKLTYKTFKEINTNYKFEFKEINQTYSNCKIGDVA